LYDDTLFAPWLALTVRSFPLVYLIVWFGLQSIPRQTIECASLDGAGFFGSFFHVVLPQLTPSLICAGLVAMAISVGDLSASVLVIPPGVTTVASRIFNLVHYGAEDELAGLCLTSITLMLMLALLSRLALARMLRTTL
jgi:iron(III) transport system permease protein